MFSVEKGQTASLKSFRCMVIVLFAFITVEGRGEMEARDNGFDNYVDIDWKLKELKLVLMLTNTSIHISLQKIWFNCGRF